MTVYDFPLDAVTPSPHAFPPFDRRWSASSFLASTPQSPIDPFGTPGGGGGGGPFPGSSYPSFSPLSDRDRQQMQRERMAKRFGSELQQCGRPCRSLTHPANEFLRNGGCSTVFYAAPEVVCTWSGQLPPRIYRNPTYSCKVFLGGVPWDITEPNLVSTFKPFGNVKVEWPGKDSKHTRHPPKGEGDDFLLLILKNK